MPSPISWPVKPKERVCVIHLHSYDVPLWVIPSHAYRIISRHILLLHCTNGQTQLSYKTLWYPLQNTEWLNMVILLCLCFVKTSSISSWLFFGELCGRRIFFDECRSPSDKALIAFDLRGERWTTKEADGSRFTERIKLCHQVFWSWLCTFFDLHMQLVDCLWLFSVTTTK